jgi:nitric oxide reductase large subunit
MSRTARIAAVLAVLALAGTYLAVQVDFLRRHRVGIEPERYWLPQLTHIWLPGLGSVLVLAAVAFVLHRRGMRE